METTLSPALENYLKAIYLLQKDLKVVRVKDLAHSLNLRMASVVGGLKTLKDRGFVIHERYGYIELTQKGLMAAKEVYRRHQVLHRFLTDILNVPEEQAEEDACAIEHYISQVSLRSMVTFIESYQAPEGKETRGADLTNPNVGPPGNVRSLARLKVGEEGQVHRIEGEVSLKRKLLDMGMVPGTVVRVITIAPFGSPMILSVRGYHLSLRREELESVLVKSL